MDARGSVIAGRYRLVELVGTGGMGSVWEAWDERLHRRVALKQLHPQPQLDDADAERSKNRAMREARITARLHHPNAVPVFDVVEHEGRPCLIMQFLPSRPLSAVLREDGSLTPVDAARIGAEVAAALAAAHALGIVHRDVKPGNILIVDDGRAMLSDFGISHSVDDETLTTTGVLHGTPAYLAPEVARGGAASFASDVYSLGGTLYTAVEGRPPFGSEQNSMALLHRITTGEIVPPRHSGALTPELLRMLSTDPGNRPSMPEVAGVLRHLATSERTNAPAASPEPAVTDLTAVPATRALTPPAAPSNQSAPASVPVPVLRSRGRRVRTITPVLLVATVLVAIAIGIVALLNGLTGRGATAADTTGPAPSATTTRAASTATPSATMPPPPPTPTPSATTPPRTATRSPSPEPSSTPSASTPAATAASSTAPVTSPTPPSDTDLARAITDYYALLPNRTEQGWSRLTRSYQTGRARDRQTYDRFWGAISRVSVSGVSGRSPDRAQATVTYVFTDGRTARERTSYGLVQDGSTLKIDSSTVVSSTGE